MFSRKSLFLVALVTALSFRPAVADDVSEVLRLVNVARAEVGAEPLVLNAKLAISAQRHSDDMATKDFWGHTGSDSSTPLQRITAAGYHGRMLGENVGAGYASPETIMWAWMMSPGHRTNILNPVFRDIGIGVAHNLDSKYRFYWTQDFGTTNPVPPPTPVPPSPPAPAPPKPPTPAPTSGNVQIGYFWAYPTLVRPGEPISLCVLLDGVAGKGGFQISLKSSAPEIAHVPARVTIPENYNQATLIVRVRPVRRARSILFTVTHGMVSRTVGIRVLAR